MSATNEVITSPVEEQMIFSQTRCLPTKSLAATKHVSGTSCEDVFAQGDQLSFDRVAMDDVTSNTNIWIAAGDA